MLSKVLSPFNFKGRIGRMAYFGYSLGLAGPLFFVGNVLVAAATHPRDLEFITPVLIPIFGLAFWVSLSLATKRLHDLGKPGTFMLVYVGLQIVFTVLGWTVPAVILMIAVGALMLFKSGEPEANQWGPPLGRPEQVAAAA